MNPLPSPITWDTCTIDGIAQIKCLESLFVSFIKVVGALTGIIFFLMFVIGGMRYLFSGGNPKALEGAKGTLLAAFLGMILIVSSFLIINLVANFTGLDLTIFKIVTFDNSGNVKP